MDVHSLSIPAADTFFYLLLFFYMEKKSSFGEWGRRGRLISLSDLILLEEYRHTSHTANLPKNYNSGFSLVPESGSVLILCISKQEMMKDSNFFNLSPLDFRKLQSCPTMNVVPSRWIIRGQK